MTGFWIGLAVLLAATIGGAAFAGVRVFETRKSVKNLQTALRPELERIAGAQARSASELEAAAKAFERLEQSLRRLRTARARVRLLRNVLGEIESLAERVRSFVPDKKPV